MAKFKFTLGIGFVSGHETTIEIPDEELEGLSKEERDKVIEEYWNEWANDKIDGGWEEVEE
ncbi:hypothetical protein V3851_04365 [Paenibacillus sp. M1]|uniref:DUF7167 domain-containing protein n=1 Tax=Paenibacillus haidiansis TaxID=1574488 RepID=A0ABU7VP94_9BACL